MPRPIFNKEPSALLRDLYNFVQKDLFHLSHLDAAKSANTSKCGVITQRHSEHTDSRKNDCSQNNYVCQSRYRIKRIITLQFTS